MSHPAYASQPSQTQKRSSGGNNQLVWFFVIPVILSVILPTIAPIAFKIFWEWFLTTSTDYELTNTTARLHAAKYAAATVSDGNSETFEEYNVDFTNKRALVVGGSRGIGRGIAFELAKNGAFVDIVGSSQRGKLTAQRIQRTESWKTKMNTLEARKKYRNFVADLHKTEGCEGLIESIAKQNDKDKIARSAEYDMVVFTVGQWPDTANPNTPSGFEKGVFLAGPARFCVLDRLVKANMLIPNAAILNVLASAQEPPMGSLLPGGSDDAFREWYVPRALTKNNNLTRKSGQEKVSKIYLVFSVNHRKYSNFVQN